MMSQRLTLRQRNRLQAMRLVQSTAMEMFERDGYEKSTIEDVAAACGVSASTIYRHFTTKENVVLWDERDSVIDDELGRLLGSLPPVQAFRDAVVAGLAERDDAELFRRRLRLIYSQPSIWSVAALQDRQNRSELAHAFAITAGRTEASLRDESLAAVCLVALDLALERWQRSEGGETLAAMIDHSLESVFESA
jgi:AcrR family transcriptional regulator